MALRPAVVRRNLCMAASRVLGSRTPTFLKDIERWEKQKGVTWTVNRFKAIYNASLKCLAGQPAQGAAVLRDAGVRAQKARPHIAAGVVGRIQWTLFKAFEERDVERVKECFALMRSYTGLVERKTTKAQWRKCKEDITSPSTSQDSSWVNQLSNMELLDLAENKAIPKALLGRHQGRYNPRVSFVNGTKSCYFNSAGVKFPNSILNKPYAQSVISSILELTVPPSVERMFPENPVLLRNRQNSLYRPGPRFRDHVIGEIRVIQEGGAKARVVACPNFWTKYYFYPLHHILLDRLKELEQEKPTYGISCVLDQKVGAYALDSWFKQGKTVHSVDLSAATDRFPLQYQLDVLRVLNLEHWVEPLVEASRGPWLSPPHPVSGIQEDWSYTVGQPMGLPGSFPLFHVSHFMLLSGMAHNLHQKEELQTYPAFAVLGDDVVIADDKLYERYLHRVQALGLSVSAAKCFDSGRVSQFAGFLAFGERATNDRKTNSIIFRPFKFGADFSLQDKEVNVLEHFSASISGGKDGKRTKWPRKWSKLLDEYQASRDWRDVDLSPLFPKDREAGKYENQVSPEYWASLELEVSSYIGQPPIGRIQRTNVNSPSPMLRPDVSYGLMFPQQHSRFDPDLYNKEMKKKRVEFNPSRSAPLTVWTPGELTFTLPPPSLGMDLSL